MNEFCTLVSLCKVSPFILRSGNLISTRTVFFSLTAKLGYDVLALTGKEREEPYLKSLGASGILLRSEFSSDKPAPLGKELFGGVVDAVGGNVVANLLPQVK